MQHRRNDAAAVIQPMDVNWWGCLLLADIVAKVF
jgi:hypothetical protein